jgi:Zn-dependent metalloprotease
MYKQIILLVLSSLFVGQIMAQQKSSVTAGAIGSANTDKGTFYFGNRDEPPRAIEFKENTVATPYFLANINSYFKIPVEYTFTETESTTDNLGMRHRLLQQNYKGIPLEGMGYRVHERNGFVTSANGKAVRSIQLDPQVTLSEQQAFQLAKQYLQTKDTTVRQGEKLIVSKDFTFSTESFSVAFQFDIDVSLIERWRVSIDARNGQLINKVSLVNNCFSEKDPTPLPYGTGTGLTNYYGTKTIRVEKFQSGSSRLIGQTEHGGIIGTYDFRNVNIISLLLFWEFHKVYDFYSSNNTYNLPYYRTAVSVQWAAEQAYEYYFKRHNRNSFNNLGGEIKSYVRIGDFYDNAFWNGKIMAFGEGSNNNPLVELDVVGHELTHAVTQYEANLQYYGEYGALNESFSDIFAKAIEFDTFGDTATWQLAKHFREGGLRDFSNPNLKNQPDTYAGDLWYTGSGDSGGVHYNSGVQNFWYYLLCEGGNGLNDRQVSYSVNAIGMEAATKIAYRNLTEYLGYFSDYLDSRIGSLLATADLYGKNSTIYQEVDKAWDAVGVIDEPIITRLEIFDITATTAKIRGSLLPRGDTVTYRFEYGTTLAFGSSSPTHKFTNKVEGILTGLQSETKYFLRLVATNENGSSYDTTEFTTLSLAPLVKIKQTVDVTKTTATLYGQVNPNSLPTSFYFEYGPTPAFGLVIPSFSLPDTTEYLNVSVPIANLQPRQNYYYRLMATNGFASSPSEPAHFFTAVKPVINSYAPITALIDTELTITGENFNPTLEKNIVSFGATRATVLSASSTQVKVKVPGGASLGPITLLDVESGLVGESVREFVPTFIGEFNKRDMHLNVGINDIGIYQALVQDMDGDNKPDIVARHSPGFSVFQNVHQGGDITLESFVRNSYPLVLSGMISLVDFDGNGLKDIIGGYQNGLRIYPNHSVPGFIFFGPPVDLPIGYLENLAFADFDLDGHIDIAGNINTWFQGGTIIIFRNKNPKGFLSSDNFEKRYQRALPYFVNFLTVGDLNNDGASDVIVGSNSADYLSIFKNTSQPNVFVFEESSEQNPSQSVYAQYISRDLNQDSRKDIISYTTREVGNLAIMENNGMLPNISFAAGVVIPSSNVEEIIRTGDINGDGKVDMMVGLGDRKFTFLKNKTMAGTSLTNSSFEKFEEYGLPIVSSGSSNIDTQMTINDLNGDGRPEVINAYSYYYGPRDGYQMEIWQNSPPNCLDPSLVKLTIANNTAKLLLPDNTTLDQFEIEYTDARYSNWYRINSTTLNLWSATSYRLRVRAKCYLGFTDYFYKEFKTDCVDANNLYIGNVGPNSVSLSAYNLSSFEIQYSPTNKDQWIALPQNTNQILNLSPGTLYDIRSRGRCPNPDPVEFTLKQFTTLCPKLATLTLTDIRSNKATVNWTSSHTGNAILEYSTDNVNWILIGENRVMFPLAPVRKYYVRGKMSCPNVLSDFIYTSFTTPCPKVSTITIDAVTPFSSRINWIDDTNTGNYTLTYSITAGGAVTTVQTRSTSFTLNNLMPGTNYTVRVAPECVSNKDFTSTTFSTVCFVPFDLSVKEVTHTTAELSWSDTFGGVPYYVDYSVLGSNNWLTAESLPTTFSLTGLRPASNYEVRIHINCLSEKAPFVSQLFKTNVYKETTIAPNPTDKTITIYPSQNLIGNRFSLYDQVGKQVATGELRDYTIDLSVLSPGFYTLKIDGEKTIKIVKN